MNYTDTSHHIFLFTVTKKDTNIPGRIQDFHWGAQTIICKHAHHEREARSPLYTAGVHAGPLIRALKALGV